MILIMISNLITKISLEAAVDYNCSSKINIWVKRLLKNYKYRIQHNKRRNNKGSSNWNMTVSRKRTEWTIWMTSMKLKILECSLSNKSNNNNQLLTLSKKKINHNLFKNSRPLVKRRKRRRKRQKIISKYNKK